MRKTTAKQSNKMSKTNNNVEITVQNAETEPDTKATILVQNQIDYEPKVSVIIPVYNVEEYLRQCLDSVINQTLKEIEIICVDDGSTDSSLEILKEYAAKDHRITLIIQQNLHAGVARNAGLTVAKGEYLSFLDSDDFFELNMLEETYNKAIKDNSDIVIFNCFLYDEKLNKDNCVDWTLRCDYVKNFNSFNYNDISDKIFNLSNCWVWNRLYNHTFIDSFNLHFQNISCGNDTFFSCLSSILAKNITCLNERLIHYRTNRISNKNLTNSNSRKKNATDLLKCFYDIYNKLNQLNIFEKVKKSYLQVVTEHIFWEKNHIQDDNIAFIEFTEYLKKYDKIFSDIKPFADKTLNKKYSTLRNILIDAGVFKEIPKRIFYVWGANEPKREEVIKCIETWKKFLPDYEIIEINDESTKYFNFQQELNDNEWFRTVYSRKMWAYVADYIRIKTLYNNGGIYFDTDVSVVQNMDKFLNEPAFVGIQCSSVDGGSGDWVEPAICGAQKHNSFFEKVLSFYNKLIWQEPIYTMPQLFNYYLRAYDIFPFPERKNQQIIKLNDITIYPERFFIPYRFRESYNKKCIEKDTHTIHWWGGSWTKPEVIEFLKNKHLIKCNNTMHKMSIIVSIYNADAYLDKCLTSIINQTLKDIEIICINDGSTDQSLSIIQKYAEKDKRIIIINQENQGLSCSRNNAMKIAKGEYIQFVDADDWLAKDASEQIYKQCNTYKLDMLSFSGENVDNLTGKHYTNTYYTFSYLPYNFNITNFNYRNCSSFITSMAVSSCLTVYRRDFLIKNQITFPDHLCFEDNFFFTKALFRAKQCGILNKILYYRRIHSNSITQNINKHFEDYLKIVDKILYHLSTENIPYPIQQKYRKAYIGRCINMYNSFKKNDKHKFKKQLQSLINKYTLSRILNIKLFNFISLFSIKYKNNTLKYSILYLNFFSKIVYNEHKTKYHILGIPVLKIYKD